MHTTVRRCTVWEKVVKRYGRIVKTYLQTVQTKIEACHALDFTNLLKTKKKVKEKLLSIFLLILFRFYNFFVVKYKFKNNQVQSFSRNT